MWNSFLDLVLGPEIVAHEPLPPFQSLASISHIDQDAAALVLTAGARGLCGRIAAWRMWCRHAAASRIAAGVRGMRSRESVRRAHEVERCRNLATHLQIGLSPESPRPALWQNMAAGTLVVSFREARGSDLPAIVALLGDEECVLVPGGRPHASYHEAFAAIEASPCASVLVACAVDRVVGTVQLTLLPGLSRRGMWRGQIEGVRVEASLRGHGIGRRLVQLAVARCEERGCGMAQLLTEASPHRFYEKTHRLYQKFGFVAVHSGTLALDKQDGGATVSHSAQPPPMPSKPPPVAVP
jgi:GNAT superfamily N-acetyltransferase